MANVPSSKGNRQKAADIVAAAGGKLVGRTRMQKLACLLELAGLGEGFEFHYRQYGPFSEDLSYAIEDATVVGLIREEELPASWGGTYSVYTTPHTESDQLRMQLAKLASEANAVELELAATAAFLFDQGYSDPWEETFRRKPDKAGSGRMDKAKELYRQFTQLETPRRLPNLA